jgi:hypothetical protein
MRVCAGVLRLRLPELCKEPHRARTRAGSLRRAPPLAVEAVGASTPLDFAATVAVESPRGFRLAKEKAGKKIDLIVALNMACLVALDEPPSAPPLTEADLAEMARQERDLLRAIG